MARIQLIAGLGNPGPQYEATRHNAGFWFMDALARARGIPLRHEARYHGEAARAPLGGADCWLLKPLTYMNRSGQAVSALARFHKIPPEAILVVHDELDIPPGQVRLKYGGGHGGHNGLRDIIAQLGTADFLRLRLGIGHPGHSSEVSNYVLTKPRPEERELMLRAIDQAMDQLPLILAGDANKAMNHLHSHKP